MSHAGSTAGSGVTRRRSAAAASESPRTARKAEVVDVLGAVRALSLALERWRVAFAKRHGLAENDSVILSHLVAAGGRGLPRDLSSAMQIRTGTLTAMLDRLEKADLIRRVPNPQDRRSNFVELTTAGTKVMARSQTLLAKRIRAVIPKELHAELAHCLGKLTTTIDQTIAAEDGVADAVR